MNASADNVVNPAVAEVNSLVEKGLRALDEFLKLDQNRLILLWPKPLSPRWTNMVYSPCTRWKKRDAACLRIRRRKTCLLAKTSCAACAI